MKICMESLLIIIVQEERSSEIINGPPGGLVRVVDGASGSSFMESPINNEGYASLDFGSRPYPIVAEFQVFDSLEKMVSSTSLDTKLYGGDTYSVTSMGPMG